MQGIKRSFVIVLVVATTSTMGTPVAQANDTLAKGPRITMVDLGHLGRPWTMTTAMNNAGEVVGLGDAGDGLVHLFRWRRGVMTDLGVKGVFGPTTATGIDDHGRVIGSYAPPSMASIGFLWEEGKLTTFPFAPTVINNRGQIAGCQCETGGDRSRALLWDDGEVIDMTPPGVVRPYPRAINERGQVLLDVTMPAPGYPHRAMLWDSGRLTDLGGFGGLSTTAADMNERGEIVGGSQTADGVTHAFLWRAGVMHMLDSPDTASDAAALNNRGQVAGHLTGPDFQDRPVAWDRNAQMIDLGTDGRVGRAGLISEHGDVAGSDYLPNDNVFRPLLWRHGRPTELPRPPGTTTVSVTSFDQSGRKLAGSVFFEDRWQAVLWLIG